jgi:[methyl-Co(III) methanol-specific corrinoid protein]:coenzyme M methyltransferase
LEVIVPFANAQFARGIDALAIGEGGAGAHMLSPELYAEFLAPVHRRLLAAIDGPSILHICGDITPRLAQLKGLGITCFNFDWAIAPAAMVEAAEGAFSLMGNISTETLLNGTPEDVAQQTRACVDAGVHIISPGCAISPRCPNVNLRAMAEAVG